MAELRHLKMVYACTIFEHHCCKFVFPTQLVSTHPLYMEKEGTLSPTTLGSPRQGTVYRAKGPVFT